jgi:ribosomal protein S18 acetylase RimI-like enzyme
MDATIKNMPHDDYEIRVHAPNTSIWNTIKNDILEIERHHFGNKAFSEQVFQHYFSNPNSVIVLITDRKTQEVVGFLFTVPAFEAYEDNFHPDRKIKNQQRLDRTAYIEDIAIHKDHMGKGLSSPLMKTLEYELWDQGYRFLELDALTFNNYAANIARNYAGRIVEQSGPHKSYYGPQVYFSIRLHAPANPV